MVVRASNSKDLCFEHKKICDVIMGKDNNDFKCFTMLWAEKGFILVSASILVLSKWALDKQSNGSSSDSAIMFLMKVLHVY